MRLPNGDHAFIAPSKLKGYLLSGTHPAGQSKAKFFRAVGFDETTLPVLQAGLLIIAKEGEVIQVSSSPHGMKYILGWFIVDLRRPPGVNPHHMDY
jgi:hypothetical protein